MVEAKRLQYHRFHQSKFRSHQLQGLHECLIQGETQAARTRKRVILPSSFVGGPQYMYNNCKDAFAICRYAGYPSYFITITCNPDWNEIKDCVADYSLKPSDKPNIISRVFKIKLDALLKDLKDGSIFGKPKGIEFQKRGLPHCHILLFVQPAEKPRSSDDIDHHILAEIPNEHTQPKLYSLVQKFMVHGPCGVLNTSGPCMVNRRCSKFYPIPFREKTAIDNAGFPKYKRSDNARSTSKRNVNLDNRFIVPCKATLLLKYGCHINVEYTYQTSAIKYLFRYVHKGNDRVTASFFQSHDSANSVVTVDEIQNYYDCRYISACEASWRLFGFEIQFKEANVIHLPFHLPNEQNVLYKDHQLIENVIEAAASKDRAYVKATEARECDWSSHTYSSLAWRGILPSFVIELSKRVPTFTNVRSVGGIVYDTFKEACYALGLLQNDREFIDALNEASFQRSVHEIKSITLAKIEKLLQTNGRNLKEFTDMLFPDSVDSTEPFHTVIFYELNFDRTELASISVDLCSWLNRDQRVAFDTIANAVSRGAGGFFCVWIRWNCGIAMLLLPNGRTAHARFKVPLSVNQDSICNIRQGTPLARVISSAKLIIWNEAPMLNKFCIEALDKCLKDVLRFDRGYNPDAPFGGKIVVLGGDFRQILPVIPRGSREKIVHSCTNASNLWQSCQVLQLTENMRLCRGSRDIHGVQLEEFAKWLLQIGDGLLGDSTDGKSVIRIPDNLLLDIESPCLHDLVLFVYPDILLHSSSMDYFKGRSILAPTLDVVTEVNNHVMSLMPDNERVYLSSDTLINEDGHLESELYTMSTESLYALNCSGIPQHRLVLKIGVPVMLLRNIDQSDGLCNGTRMQVRRLGDHVIECVILAGRNTGKVYSTTVSGCALLCDTLSTVGVYLPFPRPVFTHGQLYVALSRVNMHSELKILSVGSKGTVSYHTINVVYKKIFTVLLPNILP
ncbi:uncharacterized protein [Arachis hypogaea]|uniref:uncharacterized protein n=1 Tax=Arachis hypogaea TaxID=3818 RepID=UPI000DEC0A4A|nr:uncharacterized protein LOC112712747 [Arachis hypogaea]